MFGYNDTGCRDWTGPPNAGAFTYTNDHSLKAITNQYGLGTNLSPNSGGQSGIPHPLYSDVVDSDSIVRGVAQATLQMSYDPGQNKSGNVAPLLEDTGEPFSDYQRPNGYSPWMGLYQPTSNGTISTYTAVIRPPLDQGNFSSHVNQQSSGAGTPGMEVPVGGNGLANPNAFQNYGGGSYGTVTSRTAFTSVNGLTTDLPVADFVLTKSGSSTLALTANNTFTGANTFTGVTVTSGGTLQLAGPEIKFQSGSLLFGVGVNSNAGLVGNITIDGQDARFGVNAGLGLFALNSDVIDGRPFNPTRRKAVAYELVSPTRRNPRILETGPCRP